MKNKRIGHLWLFQFAADFAAIVAAYYTTLVFRFHSELGAQFFTAVNRRLGLRDTGVLGEEFEAFYVASAPRIILILTATLCVLYALRDLYPGRRFLRRRPVAWNVLVANVVALAIFYTYFYLQRNVWHPRSFFVTLLAFNVVYCVLFRNAVDRFLVWLRRRWGLDTCRALLVGDSGEADFLQVLIEEVHPHGIQIVERVRRAEDETFDQLVEKVRRIGRAGEAAMLIVVEPELEVAQIMRLLEVADGLDASVKVFSNQLNVVMTRARLPVDTVKGVPLVHFEQPSVGRRGRKARRALEMGVTGGATVCLLPLIGLIALVIKATSRGPVFFAQERLGVNRKPFRMLKFRTMHERADELQAELEEFNESGDGLFKIRQDPRVTPVGRALRRFSLDELPQLLNVLRGEMTLVGPRPLPRRDFANYYEEWHYGRHAGLPGLTCLWQVSGRSDIDFHNMCILDVYYLRNQNWILDLKIVLRTFWVVLFAKGAY